MKEKNVINYYVLCNKLKRVIRTGWQDWNIDSDRLESVAEHVYGVQMLAIAMYSEFNYDIDLKKVLYMLAVHELEEIIIGDLTMFQIDKEEKKRRGHEAVSKILSNLVNKEEIMNLVLEFDERKTSEAKFAYQCDKLECDLQARLYDLEGNAVLSKVSKNISINDPKVHDLLESGLSFSEMWLKFGQSTYPYDDNFLSVSNYALNNDIRGDSDV
jgi:putative hydrolase of HD superfamily